MAKDAGERALVKMNPYGLALTGAGVHGEIGFLAAKNTAGLHDALVIITGAAAFSAGIDKKVLFCEAINTGSDQTLTYAIGGQIRHLLSGSDGWKFGTLYLGSQNIQVKMDEALTQQVRPLHMVTAYQKQFESAPGKLSIDRRLKEIETTVKAMGWTGTFAIDWADRGNDAETRTTINGAVEALSDAFKAVLSDSIGRDSINACKTFKLSVKPGVSIEAKKSGDSLIVMVGSAFGTGQIGEALRKSIEESL